MLEGEAREMGLGGLSKIGLADARKKASAQRLLLVERVDPLARRKAERVATKIQAARSMTFDDCAAAYMKAHEAGWRNAKHRQQWANTLATYVTPIFGAVPAGDVDVAMVMKAVEPLWATKPETAGRVRGRIESVLDWAKARGFRNGENPARWRGHLSNLLPSRSKVHKVKHHPALPYTQVGTFMGDLRSRSGMAARALELVILCAARTGDIIGNDPDDKPPMQWTHVDLGERVWVIPSTKTDTEHRVPLPHAAVRLLKQMKAHELGDIVFPGMKAGQPLSNMAMLNLIGRMNGDRARAGQARPRKLTWRVNLPGGQTRLKEAILYISKACEGAQSFGLVKLNKILWRADFDSFSERGQPVTGRQYQRLEQGPAPIEMRPVLSEMQSDNLIRIERARVIDFFEQRPVALVEPNLTLFSRSDLSYFDRAVAIYWDKTGKETSDASHGAAWRTRENGAPMPYESAFLSDDPLNARLKKRLLGLAKKHGWNSQ
jgi:integrase